MSHLVKNAVAFLQQRFPIAPVLHNTGSHYVELGNQILEFWPMIALDSQSGVKQRGIAISNLDNEEHLSVIAQNVEKIFAELDSSIYMEMDNVINPTSHKIDTMQMSFAPRVLIYTSKVCVPMTKVMSIFNSFNTLIEIVEESEMHKTLFISYGGPDDGIVTEINKKLKSKGVKTWFFPDDALPGDKLHRMMHEGVNNHDRVLLVCSKNSLTRNGVLNEIERVLEREANEGGSEILIPITLDDYVYGDWAPTRTDIAAQVRSRVITKYDVDNDENSINKLVNVLKL